MSSNWSIQLQQLMQEACPDIYGSRMTTPVKHDLQKVATGFLWWKRNYWMCFHCDLRVRVKSDADYSTGGVM